MNLEIKFSLSDDDWLKFQIPYFFRAKRKVKGLRCGSGQGCRISWVSWATSCRGTQARFSFLRSSHWLHSVSLSNPLKFTARSNNSGCKVSTFSEIFLANINVLWFFHLIQRTKFKRYFYFFIIWQVNMICEIKCANNIIETHLFSFV